MYAPAGVHVDAEYTSEEKDEEDFIAEQHSPIPWESEGLWWMHAMARTIWSATHVMILRRRHPIVMSVNLNKLALTCWKWLLDSKIYWKREDIFSAYKTLGTINTYFHVLNFPGTAILDFMTSIGFSYF